MPKSIVGDKDPRTTSLFWRALFDNMGTKLSFLSAYHPQTDGQSEAANSAVLDLLKCYVADQKSAWEKYLPLVEFAYNNTIHASTGKAPFEIIYGRVVLPPILRTKDEIFAADEYVRDLDVAFGQVRTAIARSQNKHKMAADKHRRDMEVKEGDWVLLKFEKARLRKRPGREGSYPKLSPRYYGPFKVIQKINEVSYRLALPSHWKIHNAFHVSLFRKYVGPDPDEPVTEDPPEIEELEEILQPEQIVFHKERKLPAGKLSRTYLVKFKNYLPIDAKWVNEDYFADYPQLLQAYLEAFKLRSTL